MNKQEETPLLSFKEKKNPIKTLQNVINVKSPSLIEKKNEIEKNVL